MATIAQAAVAASVLVGLVSIPAASQSVTSGKVVSDDLPDISSSEEVPKQVSREASSDSFSAEVKTAFNEFRTEVTSGSVEASVENPNSRLDVERTPSGTTWELTASSGTLTLEESGDRVVEKSSTPYGSLEVTRHEGTREVEFEGSSREKVEKRHQELMKMMESRKEDLDERRQDLRERVRPNVEVIANSSTASGFGDNDQEHVVLVNNDLEEVNLEGWTLEDEAGSYTFPSVALESGDRLKVYSSQEWKGNEGTGISWNDGGDTATLSDSEGQEIDSESY